MTKILTLILSFLALGFYFQPITTFGIGLGVLWGGANLFFIKQLLYGLLLASPKNCLKLLLMTLVKFPLLYGAGYGLLLILSPWDLLIGLTLTLAVSPIVLHRYTVAT